MSFLISIASNDIYGRDYVVMYYGSIQVHK
jgi:hypothetical protein